MTNNAFAGDGSPEVATRARDMAEILSLVQAQLGAQAITWYRSEPIPAFGGRTAEALVSSGEVTAVIDYVEHLITGGYA